MIKINLLPVKRKKKSKPIPAYILSAIVLTVIVGAILAYLFYTFNSRVSAREAHVRDNERQINELKEKIKAVEDYERRNAVFQQRKEIIEQLSRNKTVPVKILDGISRLLPVGVWLNSLEVKGMSVSLSCTAFTNTEVVNYVNNLKRSKMFTNVYLQESIQSKKAKLAADYSLYNFKITVRVVRVKA